MTEASSGLVIGLGLGTVFVGLIAIIVLCHIMSALIKVFGTDKKKEECVKSSVQSSEIQNKQELVAVSCAVIAEELGTDVKNIKVLSFKRV